MDYLRVGSDPPRNWIQSNKDRMVIQQESLNPNKSTVDLQHCEKRMNAILQGGSLNLTVLRKMPLIEHFKILPQIIFTALCIIF
jgi:hypothetical protein